MLRARHLATNIFLDPSAHQDASTHVDFQKIEVIFYAAVSLFGVIGGVVRLCRDNVSYGLAGNIGRCLSSGLVAFGAVGIWIGPDTSSLVGPFYYLATAALIGYTSPDIQEKIFNRAINAIQEKFGLSTRNESEQ